MGKHRAILGAEVPASMLGKGQTYSCWGALEIDRNVSEERIWITQKCSHVPWIWGGGSSSPLKSSILHYPCSRGRWVHPTWNIPALSVSCREGWRTAYRHAQVDANAHQECPLGACLESHTIPSAAQGIVWEERPWGPADWETHHRSSGTRAAFKRGCRWRWMRAGVSTQA